MDIQALNGLVSIARASTHSSEILGLTSSSQKVREGFLFIAEKGVSKDGHQFLPSAISQGAAALLVEDETLVPSDYKGWVLTTTNARAIAPKIAALFFNEPSTDLFCIGVTGTNGKTSLTYLLEHLFIQTERPTGVIGTINHHLGSRVWHTEMTTPHPIELQERLYDFVSHGARALAIEVSSHALDQKRIESIEFDVGIFTNLTRDHLDYHSTMEEYFAVKKRFFTEVLPASKKKSLFAIINNDCPWGQQIAPPKNVTTWRYGAGAADITYELLHMDFKGTTFKLHSPKGTLFIQSPLVGIHNIYNVMAAVAASLAAGLSPSQIERALPSFGGIPGRLQLVPHSGPISVMIDYAHSPDALENVLVSLSKIRQSQQANGKILCVFGCGGDRDKGKRPLMAKVAQSHADFVVVTSDNPRTEDPLQIIADIESGFVTPKHSSILVEPDRAKAIALAIGQARPGDVVLIAGKGHEDYQIIGKEKFFFSDYETARKLLS